MTPKLQILDNNGRLFGIINIIDLTFLLFVLSAVLGGIWIFERGDLYKDFNPYEREYEEKKVVLVLKNQTDFSIYDLIKYLRVSEEMENDMKVSKQGNLTLVHKDTLPFKILDVTNVTRAAQDHRLYNVVLSAKLKANFDICQGIYFYKGQPLEKGNQFSIHSDFLDFTGEIVDLK